MKSDLQYILFLPIMLLVSCQSGQESIPDIYLDPVASLYDSALRPFYHGVASGDPLSDRVIIWTRVTPEKMESRITVTYEIAEDERFLSIYKSDTTHTDPSKDYTVKVEVDGLQPDHVYYYRFKALGGNSIVGRTKTTPANSVDSLRFAVVSCSNWEWGYFNALDEIANQKTLDAVVHLGDYIYEHGVGGYGDTTIGRFNIPAHEIISLNDYRTRYSQYRTDIGLRRAHQQHPFIVIWDDHEVANNSYVEGAQNHQPDEGSFEDRKRAARQAYYEWLPIRENQNLYRSIPFGPMADLIMLDERLAGRSKQLDSISDPLYEDETRSMLGNAQLNWFEEQLINSKASWKLIGNQVIFSDVDLSQIMPNRPRNLDSWDGYPAEKNHIRNHIVNNNIRNILFLTGDTHASWAFEVATNVSETYDPQTSRGAFAVELGTPSISAANSDERAPVAEVKERENILMRANPHIKYNNNRDHGFLLLTLTPTVAKAEWHYVETLRKVGSKSYLAKQLFIQRGTNQLKESVD